MAGDANDALGGAATGASIGGTVGSVVPGVGTAIGAGAGAILGGIYGFLSGGDEAEASERKRREMAASADRYAARRPVVHGQQVNTMQHALSAYTPANSALATMYGPQFALGQNQAQDPTMPMGDIEGRNRGDYDAPPPPTQGPASLAPQPGRVDLPGGMQQGGVMPQQQGPMALANPPPGPPPTSRVDLQGGMQRGGVIQTPGGPMMLVPAPQPGRVDLAGGMRRGGV